MINPGCKKNKEPEIPSIPSGPSSGSINTEYTFTSSAEDQEGDSIAIRFDWGDGDTSNWSSWKASGDSVLMSHSWSDSGSYPIRVQAKDRKDVISDWSAGHQIEIAVAWIKTFGGAGDDLGYSVQQTFDGGYIVAGYTSSFGNGLYLLRVMAYGDTLWTKTYGGEMAEGYSVQQTSDSGYIIAGNKWSMIEQPYIYLLKTDAGGNTQWERIYGDGVHYWYEGRSILQTLDGGYIFVGSTDSRGAGSLDVYLLKINANGETLWTKTYGGMSDDYGYSAMQTSDGGYIIVGSTWSFGSGLDDVYLIKTNAKGDIQWTQTYGGTNQDVGNSVRQTTDGGYIIAGWTWSFGAGNLDVYLIKTDLYGDIQWAKTYGGAAEDRGFSIQQTSDGGYVVSGTTETFGAGNGDVYLIKTNENGDKIWTKTYGGIDYDCGFSVKQTLDGGYIIAGGTHSFGDGYYDVYLIKTDANGNVK